MGSKIVFLIGIGIIGFALVTVISFVVVDQETDKSITLTNSFVESVAYKGYLTNEEYMEFISSIPVKSIKINLTHIQASPLLDGSDEILNAVFTSQILGKEDTPNTLLCNIGDVATRGIYKFVVGDKFKVDLIRLDNTMFDAILSVASRKAQSNIKILSSRTEMIVNTKY